MSGEQDRSGAKPARNPFFDETDAPMNRRAARAKPPPGIITAGGVDMARAHASGIRIREGTAAETTLDEPRVVVAVETDPRKVPTHRRLLDGRDAADDGARSAMLPGARGDASPWSPAAAAIAAAAAARIALPAAAAPPKIDPDAETLKRNRQELPLWMRVAAVLVLLLLVAGLVRRLRVLTALPDEPGVTAKAPVVVTAPPVATLPVVAPAVTAPRPPEPARTAVTAAPTGEPAATATARAAVRPPKPKPAFTPPFQLPGEKN